MLPKAGKELPMASGDLYARTIALALRTELGDTHRAIKTLMRWTGASERTAKNWLTGACGPKGEHLVALTRNSTAVLEVFLLMADRRHAVVANRLSEARDKLVEILELLISLSA